MKVKKAQVPHQKIKLIFLCSIFFKIKKKKFVIFQIYMKDPESAE